MKQGEESVAGTTREALSLGRHKEEKKKKLV